MAQPKSRHLPVSPAAFARLQRLLRNCTREVEKLKADAAITTRRMGTMQAEIDHLRAMMRGI